LVEYALILVAVSIVVIAVLTLLGEQISQRFCTIVYTLDPAAESNLCNAPIVTCVLGGGGSGITLEAQIIDPGAPAGNPYGAIDRVEFYRNDMLVNTEIHYHYCLLGGDASCLAYSVPSGNHTIRAVAYDNEGNSGTCSISVSN
jgi:Flp pilus assembly pilin Flp